MKDIVYVLALKHTGIVSIPFVVYTTYELAEHDRKRYLFPDSMVVMPIPVVDRSQYGATIPETKDLREI